MIEVVVENKIQYDVLVGRKDVDVIIISRDCFSEKDIVDMVYDIKSHGKLAYIRLERISRLEEDINDNRLIKDVDIYDYRKIMSIKGFDGILIENLDSFNKVVENVRKGKGVYDDLDVVLDYTMNVYNNETKNVMDKYFKDNASENIKLSYTYPIELSIKDMSDLSMDTLVVYSHLPVMVSANCIHKSMGKCKCNEVGVIKDRMKENVYYKSYCKYCYSKMYNPEVYYIADLLDDGNDIKNDNIMSYNSIDNDNVNKNKHSDNKDSSIAKNISYKNIRYEYSICDDKKDIEKTLSKRPAKDLFASYTRGHINKSIE